MRTAADLDVEGRRVLVRSDLNVPLEGTRITDDGRVRASVPLLRDLLDRGARVVVTAHLGRPGGTPDPAYSLAPVAARLAELLGQPVPLAADVAGPDSRARVDALGDGELVLLENVRFEAAETSKDDAERGGLADRLAGLAELYVDDAFGAVHRRHASVYDVAQRLPHAAGPLVASETAVLDRLTRDPERPYAVVLGGSKVSDKLKVIEALLPTVDTLLVGGGMCFTFLAAQGHGVGSSLLEADQVDACRRFLETGKVVLPVDVVAAAAFSAEAEHGVVAADAIPADRMGLDIGPASVARFTEALGGTRTVFWNGPMGVFELAPYAEGTRGVAEAVAARTAAGALTVVGGGDSAAAVRALGIAEDRFTHISTGGGASLERLEGKVLPGLAVLGDGGRLMARQPLLAGNWKMNLNHLEAISHVQKLAFSLTAQDLAAAEVVVLPPFVDLRSVQTLVDGERLALRYGAQDLSPHDAGAHTGDVSGAMLAKLGCSYVVVGHSERRADHGESDAVVRSKVQAAVRAGLVPLVCVGEGLQVRRSGEHVAHCTAQLRAVLDGLPVAAARTLVVAYEPVWAIGTGEVATPQDAQEVCAALRATLAELYPGEVADGVRLLYGGSVKGDNVEALLAQPDVDGALVGGASLDPVEFARICRGGRD